VHWVRTVRQSETSGIGFDVASASSVELVWVGLSGFAGGRYPTEPWSDLYSEPSCHKVHEQAFSSARCRPTKGAAFWNCRF